MKWRVLFEADNTLTAWVTVLEDDPETLYSEVNKAHDPLRKNGGSRVIW